MLTLKQHCLMVIESTPDKELHLALAELAQLAEFASDMTDDNPPETVRSPDPEGLARRIIGEMEKREEEKSWETN